MPFLGDFNDKNGNLHVNGVNNVMHCFSQPDNHRESIDNDYALQRNDTVTIRYSIKLHEDDA